MLLGWAAFGVFARMWQLGLEMRPLFHPSTAMGYPIWVGCSVVFGHFLEGVEDRQYDMLDERRNRLLEKRKRHLEREAEKKRLAEEGQAA